MFVSVISIMRPLKRGTNVGKVDVSYSLHHMTLHPDVAKVEGAEDPRRQGRSGSELPQALDNAGDAVSSAFPKGKQTGDFLFL